MSAKKIASTALACLSAATMAACSVSVTKFVSKEDLEKQVQGIATKLTMPEGATVSCDGDLEAKEGSTQRCWWSYPDDFGLPEGTKLGSTVTFKGEDAPEDENVSVKNDDVFTMADGSTKSPQEVQPQG